MYKKEKNSIKWQFYIDILYYECHEKGVDNCNKEYRRKTMGGWSCMPSLVFTFSAWLVHVLLTAVCRAFLLFLLIRITAGKMLGFVSGSVKIGALSRVDRVEGLGRVARLSGSLRSCVLSVSLWVQHLRTVKKKKLFSTCFFWKCDGGRRFCRTSSGRSKVDDPLTKDVEDIYSVGLR